MARIRKVEIRNFRAIKALSWMTLPGINCLVGQGDTGKSTIIEAIDLCLCARRNVQITDADFYKLDTSEPIDITVTIGDLDDTLKSLETYGMYLRAFNPGTGEVEEEPAAGLETVLTVRLAVEGDLEPQWTLVSERAAEQGLFRTLNWTDRVRLEPTRLGASAGHHLSWRRGSILNRVSEERPDASAALTRAAREARASFGDQAKSQLEAALGKVLDTATRLGVPVGAEVRALLDIHTVSFGGGTIALHDESAVPLRGLGLGSTRLLIAGLQRCAAQQSSMILIDEVEHGLEPHRIICLLNALGAKEKHPPLQVFMTTHSPVVVRELSGHQLFILRKTCRRHEARHVGGTNEVQGTIRRFPDALLAPSILVCEGASEVGLVRGIDHYRTQAGSLSITALGVANIHGGGNEALSRAMAFQSLGYRIAVLRDSDVRPRLELEASFRASGGTIFAWQSNRALEDELFLSLHTKGVEQLIARAIELKGEELVGQHVRSASNGTVKLDDIQLGFLFDEVSDEYRRVLGKAARSGGWFKAVTAMEAVAYEIIAPGLPNANPGFRAIIEELFMWTLDAQPST